MPLARLEAVATSVVLVSVDDELASVAAASVDAGWTSTTSGASGGALGTMGSRATAVVLDELDDTSGSAGASGRVADSGASGTAVVVVNSVVTATATGSGGGGGTVSAADNADVVVDWVSISEFASETVFDITGVDGAERIGLLTDTLGPKYDDLGVSAPGMIRAMAPLA